MPRRLPAEVAVDAIAQATAGDAKAAKLSAQNDGRAIAIPAPERRNRNTGTSYALTVFGRSTRESNCDCDRSMETSLLQTVFLRNDNQTLAMIDGRDSWLAEIAKEAGVKFTPKTVSNNNQANRRLRAQLNKQTKVLKKLKAEGGNEKLIARTQRQIRSMRERLGMQVDKPRVADSERGTKANDIDHDKIVRDAYLRTLSRVPTADEQEIALAHLTDAPDVVAGARDLLWALINTKEFIVNH